MTDRNRREFLRQSGLGLAAGTTALHLAPRAARASESNARIQLGVIGCGGRGSGVARRFARQDGCDVPVVCDPDANRAERLAKGLESDGRRPQVERDLRKVLDRRDIDAVLIATPDHWHAPAGILACEAGKHVYVEKPCSHNLREGRLLVETARRNGRVVQHGTQSRSKPLIAQAVQALREGIIGEVLVARAWNVQRRSNIGHAEPGDPPPHVDYDLWVGPAPWLPFQKNRFHYTWHWWHAFGTGDMGNDGVHELDYARWGLGVATHPSRVSALGGKLFFDDDQQFPDTQYAAFEYPADTAGGRQRMLVWEMRIWSANRPFNIDNGCEFYGTRGRMLLTKRGKLEVYDDKNRPVEPRLRKEPPELLDHQADFLDAIRNDRRPNADIATGHISASLCHLGNIATRLGRTLEFDADRERIVGDAEANGMLARSYRSGHFAVPEALRG